MNTINDTQVIIHLDDPRGQLMQVSYIVNAREQAIADIEALFPIDSKYTETNAVGERLLAQAKREYEDWRNLPDNILFRYAELCRQEENRQSRESDRHYFSNRAGHY